MYDPRPSWYGPSNYNPPPPTPPQNAGRQLSRYMPQSDTPPSVIAGRMIENPNDITPDEVPMNGSLSVFPMSDLSCIYAKGWTDKGIATVRYVPEKQIIEQRAPNLPSDFQNEIFRRLEAIERALTAPPQAPVQQANTQLMTTKEDKADGQKSV